MSRRISALPRPPMKGSSLHRTTTEAPFSASESPSPVRVLTPELGDAATTSCRCSLSFLTSFDPMSPVPPITTIFNDFHGCPFVLKPDNAKLPAIPQGRTAQRFVTR
jgi:hypothetical protein